MRRTLAGTTLLLLAGCSDMPSLGSLSMATLAEPMSQTSFGGSDIVLRPPEGWCIEPRSLRSNARESFALLADCNALKDDDSAASARGFATLAMGPERTTQEAPDALLDRVMQGRGTFQRATEDGVSIAGLPRPQDEGLFPVWRAAAIVQGRPLLVTIHAPEGSVLEGQMGKRLAQSTAVSLASQ